MGIYTAAVQQLYVAYFNRPADTAGLTYWEGVVTAAKGSTAAVSAAFAASAEYKAAYAGMDEYHVVAQVYQNLFGHGPDLPGLNYWGQLLINKQITVDNVVSQIAAGAQGSDKVAYNDKVSAATTFTAALDTPDKVLAYSGDKANGVAKSFIASVTDDASLANATAAAALASTIADVVAAAPQAAGQTFTLTAGLDNLLGTAGNDTFNVLSINPTTGVNQNNLSSFDFIDGSAGKDTLNIQIQTVTPAVGPAVTYNSLTGLTAVSKNVEIVNITADAASAATFDASLFQGATQINQIGAAAAITGLATTTTAGFNAVSTGALSVGAAGASAAVAFTNVGEAATLAVAGSKLASVSVSGTRVDTDNSGSVAALKLGVTAGKDVQTVSIASNQTTTLSLTENGASTKHITTIDASASTGAITWDETAAGTTVFAANVTTGAGKDTVKVTAVTAAATSTTAAINSVISTGAGDDTIVVANTGDGLTTIDAGAGNDTITVTKNATGGALNVMGGDGNDTIILQGSPLATTDVIDGGAGTDTIQLAGAATRIADDYIVFNSLLKNFEVIKFSSAETGLDASKLAANYTGINLAAASAIVGVGTQAITANGGVTLTAAGYVADPVNGNTYAGNLNVTDATTGTVTANSDVLTLAVKAASGANTVVTVNGDVQTANVTLTNTVNSSSAPTIDRLASVVIDNTAADAALKSITLSGNGSATVTNAGGALTTVDASALGGTLTVAGTVTDGLHYSSSNAKAETIKLGSGIDHIALNASTYGKMDTVIGLNLVLNTAGTALVLGASDEINVGATAVFNKLTTTQTNLDLALKDMAASGKGNVVFQMGGDTYIFQDKGTIGAVDSADVVVKLVGTVNLDALIVALNSTLH